MTAAFIQSLRTMGQEVAIVTSWMNRNSYIFGKVYRITDRKIVINADGNLREFSRVHGRELKVQAWNTPAWLMDAEAARRDQAMQAHQQQAKTELRLIRQELKVLSDFPLNEGTEEKLIELADRIRKFRE
jgi:hypothetical protein